MNINLDTPIENIFRLRLPQKKALDRLGLKTIENLLYHFPSRYQDGGNIKNIQDVISGDSVTLYGQLSKLKIKKAYYKKIPMAQASLSDETGEINLIWFNQVFIGKTYKNNARVKIVGKVSKNKYGLYISNPEIENIESVDIPNMNMFTNSNSLEHMYPIYKESRGITSRWFFHAIEKIISQNFLDEIEDIVPKQILKKYTLPNIRNALIWIHIPQNSKHYFAARKRFSFQEIFLIQLKRLKERSNYRKQLSYLVKINNESIKTFMSRFPFSFTRAQKNALKEILADIKNNKPMTRLLEGDVGSGKTAVAATAIYSVVTTRPTNKDFGSLQVAYMAPTEILARQHFESFIKYFNGLPVQIGFISGTECRKFPSKINSNGHTHISRNQLLKWVANGEVPILIGTHALIQKSVMFKHLALAIIDEQHRFGVSQRANFIQKEGQYVPHLLSMTATPIPRTLALTIYGDLDLSLIDELPKGRKEIITQYVSPKDRIKIYSKLKEELERGRQVYVICPRIDEPDPNKALALRVKSAKTEAKKLQTSIFSNYKVGLVHSKLKPKEKEEAMRCFEKGETNILVATSVVEVGVNVPNATNIIIEGAERFGLAQLHQLRGRVLRSSHQATCYLFSDTTSQKTKERLKALITSKNGFELAEIDLKLRGEGSLSNGKQWGLSDVGMDGIKNLKMVEAARKEAREIIDNNQLRIYPTLMRRVEEKEKIHFE